MQGVILVFRRQKNHKNTNPQEKGVSECIQYITRDEKEVKIRNLPSNAKRRHRIRQLFALLLGIRIDLNPPPPYLSITRSRFLLDNRPFLVFEMVIKATKTTLFRLCKMSNIKGKANVTIIRKLQQKWVKQFRYGLKHKSINEVKKIYKRFVLLPFSFLVICIINHRKKKMLNKVAENQSDIKRRIFGYQKEVFLQL